MTTDGLSRTGRAAQAVAAGDGHGHAPEPRSGDRPTTTVPVMPLWARPRTGVRG
ncbi:MULTISPECIES: hypothetical protein [Streptomyces]|uniref:hypothetical protein n=1 Tax=Streptomyces TaxID=1883 RepID=UPI001357214C|nr:MULTISPECIES: hypothetical protein [Streptomyces]MDC2947189.1 hypothetical protein [Streptomyces heilongjiangensis]